MERTKRGWIISFAQSRPFTGDYRVAKAAAELFTRDSLPPVRLARAIDDYMSSL